MARAPRAIVVMLSVVAAVAGACGGGGHGSGAAATTTVATPVPRRLLTVDDLPRAMVQANDLPPGYEPGQTTGGTGAQGCATTRTQDSTVLASQLQALGITACSRVTLRKETTKETATDETAAFLFKDVDGASKAIPVLRASFSANVVPKGGSTVAVPEDTPASGLGDGAAPGLKFSVKSGSQSLNLFFYIWRVRNVVSYFAAVDAVGDLNAQSILDIAKKAAARATG